LPRSIINAAIAIASMNIVIATSKKDTALSKPAVMLVSVAYSSVPAVGLN